MPNMRNIPAGKSRSGRRWAPLLSLLPSALACAGRWRACLFRDFYKQFGSRIRLLVTGMAPIRRNMGKFFERHAAAACAKSYGMVEAGSITYRPADSREYGSVGKLLQGVNLSFDAGRRNHRQPRHAHDPALFPVRRGRK